MVKSVKLLVTHYLDGTTIIGFGTGATNANARTDAATATSTLGRAAKYNLMDCQL